MRRASPSDVSSRRRRAGCLAAGLILSLTPARAAAQGNPRVFAGALFGISTLSADARSVTTSSAAAVSLYEPRNGPALNVFAGVHVAQYFSIQANWMWNRNDLTLTSTVSSPDHGSFFEQRRHSSQHAVVLDGLIYFRRLDSAVRPYLGTGLSVLHFSSQEVLPASVQILPSAAGEIASTRVGLRSHVGIDVRLWGRTAFRYSFSETISGNPISPSLRPPGKRKLMNFQNLFGFVSRF